MGILEGIIGIVTKVAETVVSAIAAAIAAPSIGSIVAAGATLFVAVGGAFLVYKGVKKLISLAGTFIEKRCNPADLPGAPVPVEELEYYREKVNARKAKALRDKRDDMLDDIIDDVDDDRISKRNSKSYKIYSLDDDSLDNRFTIFNRRRYDDDEDEFEDRREILMLEDKSRKSEKDLKKQNKKLKRKYRNLKEKTESLQREVRHYKNRHKDYVDAEFSECNEKEETPRFSLGGASTLDSFRQMIGLGPNPENTTALA